MSPFSNMTAKKALEQLVLSATKLNPNDLDSLHRLQNKIVGMTSDDYRIFRTIFWKTYQGDSLNKFRNDLKSPEGAFFSIAMDIRTRTDPNYVPSAITSALNAVPEPPGWVASAWNRFFASPTPATDQTDTVAQAAPTPIAKAAPAPTPGPAPAPEVVTNHTTAQTATTPGTTPAAKMEAPGTKVPDTQNSMDGLWETYGPHAKTAALGLLVAFTLYKANQYFRTRKDDKEDSTARWNDLIRQADSIGPVSEMGPLKVGNDWTKGKRVKGHRRLSKISK